MVAFTVRAVVLVRKRYSEQRAAEARRMSAAASEMLAIARRHLGTAEFDLPSYQDAGGVHSGQYGGQYGGRAAR